jgi:hypothetical protein
MSSSPNPFTVEVSSRLQHSAAEVARLLCDIKTITPEGARRIVARYTAAVEGNFVAWMGAAVVTARSLQGRYASAENLFVEIRDDHASMLHAFSATAQALPDKDHFVHIEHDVLAIRAMVSEMSGIKNLALMAALENLSAVFIPYLQSLAVICGSDNIAYTMIHGEADVKHADQFLWALAEECTHHNDPLPMVDDALTKTTKLLKTIFTPSS